jgi:excisionase family DNA binding protein
MAESGSKLLLDIKETAELTGFSVGTLYHWVSQRRIPFIRISPRCIRFCRQNLETWLADLTQPTRDEKGPSATIHNLRHP